MERFPFQGPLEPMHPRWWGFVYGVLPAVLMIVLIVVLVILAIRLLREQRRSATRGTAPGAPVRSGTDDAADLVRIRYARGELDRDTYLRTATDLGVPVPAEPTAPAAEPPVQT
jgi:uncharacterized membrane protein